MISALVIFYILMLLAGAGCIWFLVKLFKHWPDGE